MWKFTVRPLALGKVEALLANHLEPPEESQIDPLLSATHARVDAIMYWMGTALWRAQPNPNMSFQTFFRHCRPQVPALKIGRSPFLFWEWRFQGALIRPCHPLDRNAFKA